MKGIVFTEFLEMVEIEFGLEVVDTIITESNLDSKGVYTSVGTYNFIEIQELIIQLSKQKNIPVDELIYAFGHYFFKTLLKIHPNIFTYYKDPLTFIASIENHIHVEVRKIYPDAELPHFTILEKDDSKLEVIYTSKRAMYMFAKALMEKTFEHYGQIAKIDLFKIKNDGTHVKFIIEME
tara:strand:+ start:3948 stop:4487 length:540 start_codon:yes stop_codon:yes gene_type:complete